MTPRFNTPSKEQNILNTRRVVIFPMSPDELLVLFSSYVIAFVLVWFTNIAEAPGETKGKTEERVQAREHPALPNELVWNVGMFFGLRSKVPVPP